ncbi:MAG: M28 family metallopeptidase [Planctomycetes bacterium]|nr:M28 family metallopeptidase [Planctomycetota bacterium]
MATARATRALLLLPVVVGLVAWAAGGPARSPVAGDDGEAARAAARVEAGAAYRWLDELQARYPGRSRGTAAHRDAPAFIASSLAAAGAVDVRIERPAVPLREGAQNVLARVPGRSSAERVVLAAHHDVVPGAPGAIDDGGAIAAILEAVRALAAGPPPALDVEVAIFDHEELGLVGSRAHLRDLGEDELRRVRAALAVELVGWRRDRLVVQTIPWGFATRAEGIVPAWMPTAVRAAGRDAGVRVGVGDPRVSPWYQATVRVLGVLTGSDADAYLAAGVPACLLTGSSLTNFYEAYHRPTDDMAMVDPARLDDAARVIAAAVHELAALPDDVAARRRLGDAYLTLGLRTLTHGWLALLALALAAPLLTAALGLVAARARAAGALAGALAMSLAVAGLLGSLFGLSILGPLALGAAAAAAVQGRSGRRACLYAGLLVALVEPALLGAGAASFGFRWQGSATETSATLVGALAWVALAVLLVRASSPTPPPTPVGDAAIASPPPEG